jgi:hypothetical protein
MLRAVAALARCTSSMTLVSLAAVYHRPRPLHVLCDPWEFSSFLPKRSIGRLSMELPSLQLSPCKGLRRGLGGSLHASRYLSKNTEVIDASLHTNTRNFNVVGILGYPRQASQPPRCEGHG